MEKNAKSATISMEMTPKDVQTLQCSSLNLRIYHFNEVIFMGKRGRKVNYTWLKAIYCSCLVFTGIPSAFKCRGLILFYIWKLSNLFAIVIFLVMKEFPESAEIDRKKAVVGPQKFISPTTFILLLKQWTLLRHVSVWNVLRPPKSSKENMDIVGQSFMCAENKIS